MKWAITLAQKEGILTGVSGGATLAAAMQVAESRRSGLGHSLHASRHRGALHVDPLFEGIPEGMTEEEEALSRSTPGYQMG